MLINTTPTDYPSPGEAAEPSSQLANATDQPEPKRPLATPKTGLPHVPKAASRDRSTWETGDDYGGVLCVVPDTPYRVAVCAKGYCYLLQHRRGKDRWDNQKFFANKRRLAAVLKTLVPDRAFRAVQPEIEKLPI